MLNACNGMYVVCDKEVPILPLRFSSYINLLVENTKAVAFGTTARKPYTHCSPVAVSHAMNEREVRVHLRLPS